MHSGDLGYIDEDGCVFIQGRIKRMIIRHDGFKVFPTFVEDAVCKHSSVSACCAVGVPDRSYSQGQLPAVYIVLRPGCAKSETEAMAELRTICENELPEYARPVAYYFRDALPLTPIGKVDYRTLEKLAAAYC